MGTSPRTGLVTQPTQPEFFNQSQLVLYRLLFISHRFSLHGTLEPRDIGTPSPSTGTLEPRDIGTPGKRLSLTQHTSADLHIQQIQRCRVGLRPHGCERNIFTRRGATARQTPLTRRRFVSPFALQMSCGARTRESSKKAPDLMNDILLVPCSVRSLLLENASGAGNEETEKVADLKDEFERLERREVEVLSFA